METKKLYEKLEKDFVKEGMWDDWSKYMEELDGFLTENFKKRSIGVMCGFANEIKKVYTAVFPDEMVMKKILSKDEENIMLFLHHASTWDITNPNLWVQMNPELLKKFKGRKISIFVLHTPLDNFSEYSTSKTLGDALNIKIEQSCTPYRGGYAGIIGKIDLENVEDLKEKFENVIGHKVGFYNYGESKIQNKNVAIVAGGGNDIEFLKEIKEKGINTFITGITALNEHSKKTHEFAKENKINILGGTHYSTEKFALQRMCNYFKKLNMPSEFIEGKPVLEDL